MEHRPSAAQAGRVPGKIGVKRVAPLQPKQCHKFPNLPCISMRNFLVIPNLLPSQSTSHCPRGKNIRRCCGLDLRHSSNIPDHHLGFRFLPCPHPSRVLCPGKHHPVIFGDLQGNQWLAGISHWECALSPF